VDTAHELVEVGLVGWRRLVHAHAALVLAEDGVHGEHVEVDVEIQLPPKREC